MGVDVTAGPGAPSGAGTPRAGTGEGDAAQGRDDGRGAAGGVTGEAGARPVRARSRSEAWGVLGLILVLLAMAYAVVDNIQENPKLSPIDEVVTGDYMFQALRWDVAQRGEPLGPEITREMSCRGVRAIYDSGGPCPGTGDPQDVPGWDVTTADIHPPLYYYATAWAGRAMLTVAPFDSLITAGRVLNIVWLGAGLVLLYLAMRDLRVRVPARLAVCLLVGLTPSVVQHMSMVNVTSTAIPSGALLVLAVIRWEQRRWPLAAVMGAAALALAFKADNIVPVFGICVYLLVRAVVLARATSPQPASVVTSPPAADLAAMPVDDAGRWPRVGRSGDWRAYVIAAFAAGAAAITVELAWLAVRSSIAIGGPWSNPATVMFRRDDLRLDDLISQAPILALPLGIITPSAPLLWVAAISFIGAYVGAMFHRRGDDPLQQWGVAVTIAGLLGGPLLVFGTFVTSANVYPLPGRYGFGLVASMALLLGVALRGRLMAFGFIALVAGLAVVGPVVPPDRTDRPAPARTTTGAPASPAPTGPPAAAPGPSGPPAPAPDR